MKTQGFQQTGMALVTAGIVVFSAATVFGQNIITAPGDTLPANTAAVAPQLTPAMQQILQLSQAQISDNTIINYIQNSGTVYGLDAPQVIYLKQQGVSEAVINAMLNQHNAAAAAPTPPQTPPPNNTQYNTPPDDQPDVAQPTTPAPSTVYVVPDTQTYDYDNWAASYYYPYPYSGVVYWGGWGGRGGYYGGFHGGGSLRR